MKKTTQPTYPLVAENAWGYAYGTQQNTGPQVFIKAWRGEKEKPSHARLISFISLWLSRGHQQSVHNLILGSTTPKILPPMVSTNTMSPNTASCFFLMQTCKAESNVVKHSKATKIIMMWGSKKQPFTYHHHKRRIL